MGLSRSAKDAPPHELDVCFEVHGDGGFHFGEHGIGVGELGEQLDLSSLGETFYIVELEDFLLDGTPATTKTRFETLFEVPLLGAPAGYPALNADALKRWFEMCRSYRSLECMVITLPDQQAAERTLPEVVNALRPRLWPRHISRRWRGGMIFTHDNHFTVVEGRDAAPLATLIGEAVRAFFFQFTKPTRPKALPPGVVDEVARDYHSAPLTSFPAGRRRRGPISRLLRVPEPYASRSFTRGDVRRSPGEVQAIVETAPCSWIAARADVPSEQVGRRALIRYEIATGRWAFERLEPLSRE